ncbi:hypothetical protein MCAP1_001517 [Malassezia caprae]|uniref:ferric-chelate reductase (NADPH) n=1 Tax=Malassezia caprae TaxID=1381934 RepID=A0AAF0EAW8_9BASI|nr:hypothetical protein MCAP1_001517 [Malassezia caprae]
MHATLAARAATPTPAEPLTAYAMSYLNAHELSAPSERYVYILWILFACFTVLLGAEHLTGITQRTWIGALWTKWSTMHYVPPAERTGNSTLRALQQRLYRITMVSLRANHVMMLLVLFIPLLLLSLIGADYIDPKSGLFSNTYFPSPDEVQAAHAALERRLMQWGRGDFPRVMTHKPTYTLPYHTFWSMGSRLGDFCNALTPMVILFALKQAPLALLSLPIFGRYASNSLAFLHRWGGRLLWLYASLHTILWAIQVQRDTAAKADLWTHLLAVPRFRWAITAYIFLTLLTVLSIEPIRRMHYEFFYITHLVCVIGFMVGTWAHHPQLGGWMLAGFVVWGAERAWRLVRVIYLNYSERPPELKRSMAEYQQVTHANASTFSLASKSEPDLFSTLESVDMSRSETPLAVPPGSVVPIPFRPVVSDALRGQLFPGFAFVQPLSGQMMRLVLRTSRPMPWRPGQWLFLQLPSLSWVQSHPFTIAGSYVRDARHGYVPGDVDVHSPDRDQLIVLLIRARAGLTRRLWLDVQRRCEAQARLAVTQPGSTPSMFPLLHGGAVASQVQGVYMRAIVDGPFGDASRIDWGAHASVLLVCGGSGVSLGLSILDYLCRKIARVLRGETVHGLYRRPFLTRRVRFVWVMREYAHLQWAASALRLCLEILPPANLRVEMYVTRGRARPVSHAVGDAPPAEHGDPTLTSMGLDANDLVQFGPDEDGPLTLVDQTMNEMIRKEGQLRRARTRRARSMRRPARRAQAPPLPAEPPLPPPDASLISPPGDESFTAQHANELADEDLMRHGVDALRTPTPNAAPRPDMSPTSVLNEYFTLPTDLPDTFPMVPLAPAPRAPSPALPDEAPEAPVPAYANLDLHELQDFDILSEMTRGGYPPLDEIVGTEMGQAEGRSIAVGCGPAGLLALLRKVVSRHVHVRRAWHGDARAHANLFTESYAT